MPTLDEIEVPSHGLLNLRARAVVCHVMLELIQALDLGFPDDRPVRGDGVDHQPAVSKAVLLLGGRKGCAQLFDEQLRLARLAAEDVADHVHGWLLIGKSNPLVSPPSLPSMRPVRSSPSRR